MTIPRRNPLQIREGTFRRPRRQAPPFGSNLPPSTRRTESHLIMEHASSHYATANAITAIAARMAAKPLAPSPSDASCPHPRQPVNRGANKVDARGCARAWGGPWTFPNGPSGHDSLRSFGRGHPDRARSLRGVIRFCCRRPPTRFRSAAIFRTPRLPARDSPDASANGSG